MPLQVAEDPSLSLADLKVYVALDYLCGKRGWWYGSQASIAERLHLSTRSVERSVAKLVEAEHIGTRRLGIRFRTWTMYHVLARTIDAPDEPTGEIARADILVGSDPTKMSDPIPQTTPQTDDDDLAAREAVWERLVYHEFPTTSAVANPQRYLSSIKTFPQLTDDQIRSWRGFLRGFDKARRKHTPGPHSPLLIPTLGWIRRLLPVFDHIRARRPYPTEYELIATVRSLGVNHARDCHDALEIIARNASQYTALLDEMRT
jgi:hypothetical protein